MEGLAKSGLNIAHLNVGSLLAASKFDVLKLQVETSGVDILGISESWLTEAIPTGLIAMKGYNLFRVDRSWNERGKDGHWKRGGGLVCYTKGTLQVSDTKYSHLNCSTKNIEMQWIDVKIHNLRPIVIINVYRPPQGDYKAACKAINDSIINAGLKDNAEVYLMGDFNIDLHDKSAPPTKELIFTTGCHGLLPKISTSTRYGARNEMIKQSCIDQIFTNSSLIIESRTLDWNISDHLAVYVRRKKTRSRLRKINFEGRSYRNFDKEDFQGNLIGVDWTGFYESKDPDLCWEMMEGYIRKELNARCPVRSFRVKEIRDPWITDEILEEIKDKDNYLDRARKSGYPEDWAIARRERNRVCKLVRNAKSEFVKDRQRELQGEPRKFWKLISTIVPSKQQAQGKINLTASDGKTELEGREVADHINKFFGTIGDELAKKIDKPWRFYGKNVENDCPELRTDFEQVLRLCKNINTTKSSGICDISAKIFKCAFMVLIPQLVYLFNLSFTTGTFPKAWKSATIIPLFKSGDRTKVENYRPISLLPLPGKLLERIAHEKISAFLDECKILSHRQSGFRKGYSTVSAVADLTDDLFTAINCSRFSLAVFVDLRKAFDTVNHVILCKKLEKNGIRGDVLQWCENYLSGRTQRTLANNVKSRQCPVLCGVPQGSVLGPLFFILYVNDLQQALKGEEVQLYADDTVLYTSDSKVQSGKNRLQANLDRLHNWCQANKLTVNPSKTKMMTFGTRHSIKKTKECHLLLGGVKVQKVATFRYLGFMLDSTLNFRSHIADVIKNVMYKRTLLSKIMSFLNKDVALSIFKLMILPYFDYCDVIYHSAGSGDTEKLQRLQNKCLKTCLSLSPLCSTKTVHNLAKCASLSSRREAHVCNFMYRRLAREELVDNRNIPTRQHDAPLYVVDFPHKETFKRSVKYSGSTVWNNLSPSVRSINNYEAFKAHQKRVMLLDNR